MAIVSWTFLSLEFCTVIYISIHFLIALHGATLSFNQLQKRGHLQFPDGSVKLPDFGRPANIPQIKLPAALISASTRSRREAPLGVNGTASSNAMVEVVNVVMNNMEDYLPDTAIDDENERLGACSPVAFCCYCTSSLKTFVVNFTFA